VSKPSDSSIKIASENRKARFNFTILESHEAGIVLTGAEVKSIRLGGLSLQESYIRPFHGELFLLGAHIKAYSHDTNREYDPTVQRKLLMHKKEIEKLQSKVEQKGLTLVPLKVYFKNGRVKVEVALGKGKNTIDKRSDIKEKDAKRDIQRRIKSG
jgi:SsrA-binding protein